MCKNYPDWSIPCFIKRLKKNSKDIEIVWNIFVFLIILSGKGVALSVKISKVCQTKSDKTKITTLNNHSLKMDDS